MKINDLTTTTSNLRASACQRPQRHSRRTVLAILIGILLVLIAMPVLAALTVAGTYTTPLRQGTIQFTALRGFRGGMEGSFKVDGKISPGSLYAARGGGTGLVWYYGVSGIMAGNALVTLQPDGTYSGPIWFFDRKGNTTSSGTTTVTIR